MRRGSVTRARLRSLTSLLNRTGSRRFRKFAPMASIGCTCHRARIPAAISALSREVIPSRVNSFRLRWRPACKAAAKTRVACYTSTTLGDAWRVEPACRSASALPGAVGHPLLAERPRSLAPGEIFAPGIADAAAFRTVLFHSPGGTLLLVVERRVPAAVGALSHGVAPSGELFRLR